jgi:methyl-accepting chemotaxis protein
MDFDGAILAHVEWKTKLRAYMTKSDGSLKSSMVAQDSQCNLGKWIYSDGIKYSALPAYQELKAEHAKFHKSAAKIVDLVNAGKLADAEAKTKAGSEFKILSTNCVALIMKLRDQAQK